MLPNPTNPYPNITKLIKQDLQEISDTPIRNFRFIRAKSGVYVYKCLYDDIPAVVKYLENEDDRREILNYRILATHGIPTIKTYALGKVTLVMEDISVSEDWRLGIAEDLSDAEVAASLARWYFTFHENGASVPELDTLFFEYDSFTEDNFKKVIQKFPESEELFRFLISNCDKLRELIHKPSFTLTYNDFYWTNFVVRNNKKAAMMFDYNLLGKGYRYSDFRNVCWSMSDEARMAFENEYNGLYMDKHGHARTEAECFEKQIDDVAGSIYVLIIAFTEREGFPDWGEEAKNEVLNGSLLIKAKLLLKKTNRSHKK